jgi:CHAT domain-containing protein/Tfp pilus assembly protein PilF
LLLLHSLGSAAQGGRFGRSGFSAAGTPTDSAPIIGQERQDKKKPGVLAGRTLTRELAGGHAHRYRIKLGARQFIRVEAEQEGIDVVLGLVDAAGRKLIQTHRLNGTDGPEELLWVARKAVDLWLEVRVLDNKAPVGRYQLRLAERRNATPSDEVRLAAQAALSAGNRLRELGDDKALREAPAKYEEAIRKWSESGEKENEAYARMLLGWTYVGLKETGKAGEQYHVALNHWQASNNKRCQDLAREHLGSLLFLEGEALRNQETPEAYRLAIAKFDEAAKQYRAEGNKLLEVWPLRGAGLCYCALGEKTKALEYYEQMLQLLASTGTRVEAVTLNDIGNLYFELGEKEKALEHLEQALDLFSLKGDKSGEATARDSIGNVYSYWGEKKKALEYYEQAKLLRGAPDPVTLNNIGKVYADLGEKAKALERYGWAFLLHRAVGESRGEALTLNNIGELYSDLADYATALKYLGRAAQLAVGDRSVEAAALNNIGKVYFEQGEFAMALDYYQQALQLFVAVGDRSDEAITVNNIGNAYFELLEPDKALKYCEQALELFQAMGDRSGEAAALTSIGSVYSYRGMNAKALEFYEQALALARAATDASREADLLRNLMLVWKGRQQPRLAAYFGKQAINRYQELRAAISSLDKGLQRSFLKSKENTYRELADVLISLGRLPEAQQVLDLLKEEEYFSYVRGDKDDAAGLSGRAAMTPTEARLTAEYAEIADRVTAIGRELEELNRLKEPRPEQRERRDKLNLQLQTATQAFQAFLRRLEKDLGNTVQSGERLSQIASAEGLQDTLRELGTGTVALYTVVGEKKYSVILVTPNAQVAGEYAISRDELNRKVQDLRSALMNPAIDPRPLAADLYRIVIGPIEKNLEGAQAVTLMWSLDGTLRYVPMAALYDDRRGQYLVERYRMAVYTPAGASDLKNAARASWTGLGFGVSKDVNSPEVGHFDALRGVPAELYGIIETGKEKKGVMQGEVYLDEQFTEQKFTDELRKKQYPLIHIASHFSFKPGDGLNSFLLLGDGKPLTLEKINSMPNLFSEVDLLALSACETGVGEKDQEGREVEGFGVLAQRKGAKAVLATLWSVRDESTTRLTVEFYRLRESKPGMNKAEALREAQLSLLGGKGTGVHSEKTERTSQAKSGEANQSQPKFKPDPDAPYAHPYYWAPFVLIGNWK